VSRRAPRSPQAAARIAPLAAGERERAAGVLARAFRDSPLNRAVIGPDPQRRLRANLAGARALLPSALAHGSVLAAHAEGELRGVLVAAGPFAWPLPAPPVLVNLRRVLGQGLAVARRWALVFEALARVHPQEPHAYLATLGVDPDAWSCGLGSALLAHWLEGVDRQRLPAYLETDRAANVAFYQRAGFEVCRQSEVLGVAVWCMGRPAGGVPAAAGPH